MTVSLTGCVVIEGVSGAPSPVIVIVATCVVATGPIGTLAGLTRGVVHSVLVMERFAETLPIAVGEKLAVKLALCPGTNVNGSDGPLILKLPPDEVICVIVEAAVPEFVSVRL